MALEPTTLEGEIVRLEPLSLDHVDGLAAASGEDPSLYRWAQVPQGREAMEAYVRTALDWTYEGTALPFAIVRRMDGRVVGSTRFFDAQYWPWPASHARYGRAYPDVCEIGYSWLGRSSVRTGANVEAKLLMLRHAFESWEVFRVCLHTDVRNERSRTAILALGATFEGVLRAHRLAVDLTPRDSARYSILRGEWPEVQDHLSGRLAHPSGPPSQGVARPDR
jgi:N-acetyltransferase